MHNMPQNSYTHQHTHIHRHLPTIHMNILKMTQNTKVSKLEKDRKALKGIEELGKALKSIEKAFKSIAKHCKALKKH